VQKSVVLQDSIDAIDQVDALNSIKRADDVAIPDYEMRICILYVDTHRVGLIYVPIGYDVRVGCIAAARNNTIGMCESSISND